MKNDQKTTLKLENTLDALSELEASLNVVAENAGLEKRIWHRSRLVAEELFVNIVSHGYPNGGPGLIEWTIFVQDGAVYFDVIDDGVEFIPQDPKPKASSLEEVDYVGGHGMGLISTLAPNVQFLREDGKNRCRIRIENFEI